MQNTALVHYTVLAAEAMAAPDVRSGRLQRYKEALKAHDWHYAARSAARLMLEAADLDVDSALWNADCPPEFRRGLQ